MKSHDIPKLHTKTTNKKHRISNLIMITIIFLLTILAIILICIIYRLRNKISNVKSTSTTQTLSYDFSNIRTIPKDKLKEYSKYYEDKYSHETDVYNDASLNSEAKSLRDSFIAAFPNLQKLKFYTSLKICGSHIKIEVLEALKSEDKIAEIIEIVFQLKTRLVSDCSNISQLESFIKDPTDQRLEITQVCGNSLEDFYPAITIVDQIVARNLSKQKNRLILSRLLIISKLLWNLYPQISRLLVLSNDFDDAFIPYNQQTKISLLLITYLFDVSTQLASLTSYVYFVDNYDELIQTKNDKLKTKLGKLNDKLKNFEYFETIKGGIYLFHEMVKENKEEQNLLDALIKLKGIGTEMYYLDKSIKCAFDK
eukprot:GAHX01000769.1.p1 GENE.GAHX01000769.1~~GAHX01000769.1.p1  ORF type:complete len:368 (-),score=52.37 GAHX01000769.1:133-1236(-)